MSTAVRRSATLFLLLALLFPGLMRVTSGTAYADVRVDQRAVDGWLRDYVRTEGLDRVSVAVIKNGGLVTGPARGRRQMASSPRIG